MQNKWYPKEMIQTDWRTDPSIIPGKVIQQYAPKRSAASRDEKMVVQANAIKTLRGVRKGY